MEIQRHPSRYANAAQWLRYSNVSHPGDVEELTQTEQGGGNTEGSGDRTGGVTPETGAATHPHTRRERERERDATNSILVSMRAYRETYTHFIFL